MTGSSYGTAAAGAGILQNDGLGRLAGASMSGMSYRSEISNARCSLSRSMDALRAPWQLRLAATAPRDAENDVGGGALALGKASAARQIASPEWLPMWKTGALV